MNNRRNFIVFLFIGYHIISKCSSFSMEENLKPENLFKKFKRATTTSDNNDNNNEGCSLAAFEFCDKIIFNKNGLLKYYDDPTQVFLIQHYSKIPKNCKILLCLATMQTILLETELYLPNSYIVDIDLSKEIPITTMKIDCDVSRIPTHAKGIMLPLQNGVKSNNENRTLPLNDIIGNLRTIVRYENDDGIQKINNVNINNISNTTTGTMTTTTDNNPTEYNNGPTTGVPTNANAMRRNNYIKNTTMTPWLYSYYNLRKSSSIQPYFNELNNDSSNADIDIPTIFKMLESASHSVNNSIDSSTSKPAIAAVTNINQVNISQISNSSPSNNIYKNKNILVATPENRNSISNTNFNHNSYPIINKELNITISNNAPDFLNKDTISMPLIVTPSYDATLSTTSIPTTAYPLSSELSSGTTTTTTTTTTIYPTTEYFNSKIGKILFKLLPEFNELTEYEKIKLKNKTICENIEKNLILNLTNSMDYDTTSSSTVVLPLSSSSTEIDEITTTTTTNNNLFDFRKYNKNSLSNKFSEHKFGEFIEKSYDSNGKIEYKLIHPMSTLPKDSRRSLNSNDEHNYGNINNNNDNNNNNNDTNNHKQQHFVQIYPNHSMALIINENQIDYNQLSNINLSYPIPNLNDSINLNNINSFYDIFPNINSMNPLKNVFDKAVNLMNTIGFKNIYHTSTDNNFQKKYKILEYSIVNVFSYIKNYNIDSELFNFFETYLNVLQFIDLNLLTNNVNTTTTISSYKNDNNSNNNIDNNSNNNIDNNNNNNNIENKNMTDNNNLIDSKKTEIKITKIINLTDYLLKSINQNNILASDLNDLNKLYDYLLIEMEQNILMNFQTNANTKGLFIKDLFQYLLKSNQIKLDIKLLLNKFIIYIDNNEFID